MSTKRSKNSGITVAKIKRKNKRIFRNASWLIVFVHLFLVFFFREIPWVLGIIIFTLFTGLFYIYQLSTKFSSAYINGDFLIIRTGSSNVVTSLYSVKNIHSRKILNSCYTSLDYHLDGANRQVYFITDCKTDSPHKIISRAKEDLKNKKANL